MMTGLAVMVTGRRSGGMTAGTTVTVPAAMTLRVVRESARLSGAMTVRRISVMTARVVTVTGRLSG
ncbi:hypothetical protein ACWF62_20340, partial [Rhodococcus sp. NPDC054953]